MEATILAAIVNLLWFTLGYQACRIWRKWKDLEFLTELYSAILKKAGETDLIMNSNGNKDDIINEGKQD